MESRDNAFNRQKYYSIIPYTGRRKTRTINRVYSNEGPGGGRGRAAGRGAGRQNNDNIANLFKSGPLNPRGTRTAFTI